MADEFAAMATAEVRHLTQKLPAGVGSPNVIIEGHAAWRAEVDVHPCPEHGDEIVKNGSDKVLINDRRATRRLDFLESAGAGPVDPIQRAANSTKIGATDVGLGQDAAMDEFCKDICGLENDWNDLPPDERRARYEEIVGRRFDAMGMPRPTYEYFKPGGGIGAYWSQGKWKIGLPNDTFTKDFNRFTMRKATYHELRHAEQTVMSIRARAGRTPVADRPALIKHSGVPFEVGQRAIDTPLDPNTAEGRYGDTHAEQQLNEAGRKESARVNGDIWREGAERKRAQDAGETEAVKKAARGFERAVEDYEHQPGGSDAKEVASRMDDTCHCPPTGSP